MQTCVPDLGTQVILYIHVICLPSIKHFEGEKCYIGGLFDYI